MPWPDKIEGILDRFCRNLPTANFTLLTEGDLQTRTVNALEEALASDPPRTTVNTQSPWHDENTGRRLFFIDITIFDSQALEVLYRPNHPRKGYRYSGEAVAIELKFVRHRDDVRGISGDIQKLRNLAENLNSNCFVLAVGLNDNLTDEIINSIQDDLQDNSGTVKVLVQSLETQENRLTGKA